MKKRSIIFGSICMILLISLVGGTLAWFYINEEVTVGYGNSVFCEAGDSLEISLVENGAPTRWSSSIDYSAGEFTVVDITGDGTKLFRPTEIDENQQPVGFNVAVSSLENAKEYDYVELEVAFRAVSKMNVYLSEESFIEPVNAVFDNEKNPNIYGNFSRDYIAGAMRVAIVDDSGLKMLWAPNSGYQLSQNDKGTSFSFNAKGAAEADYSYYVETGDEENPYAQQTVPADMYANNTFVVDSTGADKEQQGNSPVLVSLNPKSEGESDTATVKIRIWFEGTDREAHQALAGGNVNIKLKFVGIQKEENTEKQAIIDAVESVNQITSEMVYSINGRNWWKLGQSGAPDLTVQESGTPVYVKFPYDPAQPEYYETTCKKITIN